jgi:hypothetical protein
VVPSLSPLSSAGADGAVMPPPPKFLPPRGKITRVAPRWRAYQRQKGNSSAKEAGLRFESQLVVELHAKFPTIEFQPEFRYHDSGGQRICFPDAVLRLSDRTVVFEVKLAHSADAWWQLEKLYRPVLAAWSLLPVQVIEIVKSYDAAIQFPVPVHFITDIEGWVSNRCPVNTIPLFGVWKWAKS